MRQRSKSADVVVRKASKKSGVVQRRASGAVPEDRITDEAERLGAGHEIRQLGLAEVELEPRSGFKAAALASATMRLYAEWARVMLGRSDREIPAKDPRFSDPTWRDHPLYRRLGQGYLAFCDAVDALAEDNEDWRKRERAKFLTGIVTSSLAPSNTLLGNPAALKRAFESGGSSLVTGLKNMVDDLVHNKGMPSQVDKSTFKVGQNLAVTPGAVVFRNEMVELLQYQPMTPQVCERPTLMIVPPIGKYYFMDLAPKRSFIEYAVSQGVPMFVTSWRNPGPEHAHWGLDDYVQTCLDLVNAVCEISGRDKLSLVGMCAGGIISTLMLCIMAARGDKRVGAATFGVMLLDFASEVPIGAFNARPVLALGKRRSASKGILPASDLANVFAWMRPNDLVWNYWANNYLMGNSPPSFDILAWSVDGTNLPGKLHEQFLAIFRDNLVATPGALTVLGVPIDLRTVRVDALVTGALTDHLTPWKACYRTTQLLGGTSTFNVLGTMNTNGVACKYMCEIGGGNIINFGSESGLTGEINNALYASTKAAVHTWTRNVARQWGPHGIRVNAVLPYMVTPMYEAFRKALSPEQLAAHDAETKTAIPLGGKFGDAARDLAPVMVFLASDASHFMTGQMFPVDGGLVSVR